MAKLTVTVSIDNLSAADLANLVPVDKKTKRAYTGVIDVLTKVASGTRAGYFEVETGTAFATATATCDQSSAVAATDELTIGPITCTSVASGPTVADGEWILGASDEAMAVNIAAAINGATANANLVTATASAGVVTITSKYPGAIGNAVALGESGDGITLSGAYLAGGAGGAQTQFARGTS